ncbi:MAG TPA: gephyrin-like molybdotransferase Glp [Vicinamibacterales bacterium]|nr:gephyrin-like molybdotransferase Glp [Vicinamibacterales bacterium]
MRPIRETIPLEEARALIAEAARPVDRTETVPLARAHGRVLARTVVAAQDVPPFARAAMDGFAVVASDTFGAGSFAPRTARVIETVHTGEVPTRSVSPGECVQIATGAPMPEGADAVVMVEETDKGEGALVRIFSPVYPGQNVGRQGADIQSGQTVLEAGNYLTSARVGVVAALGLGEVEVFARPRVALLSTGDEIVDPGRPLPPGHIYDINRYTLSAIVEEHGGVPVPHATSGDDLDHLSGALDACLVEDLVVFSGGSSVGERDLVLDLVSTRGEVVFHGIAVKPGKPTLFGVIQGKPVLGMPGYPTSCLSNGYMLLVPLLRQMARLPQAATRTLHLPLGQRVVSTTGRHQFYTVRVVDDVAMPAFKASGDITSMSQADGYIEIAAQTDIVEKGEIVEVKLF